MALMSRLDVMQHALDEQRKDERRKESEALHQLKWRRIALRRPHAPAKAFVPVADSDADFEMLRARVATLRLVQRRLEAECDGGCQPRPVGAAAALAADGGAGHRAVRRLDGDGGRADAAARGARSCAPALCCGCTLAPALAPMLCVLRLCSSLVQ